jgi:hypothetical protein
METRGNAARPVKGLSDIHEEAGNRRLNECRAADAGPRRHEHERRLSRLGVNMHRLACREYVDLCKGTLVIEDEPKNAGGTSGARGIRLDLGDVFLSCRTLRPRRDMLDHEPFPFGNGDGDVVLRRAAVDIEVDGFQERRPRIRRDKVLSGASPAAELYRGSVRKLDGPFTALLNAYRGGARRRLVLKTRK